MYLTDKEYEALLNLFHEYHAAFLSLDSDIQAKFYHRLYNRGN